MRCSINGGCQVDATGTSIDEVMCGGESTVESVENYIGDVGGEGACLVGQRLVPKRGAVVTCSNFDQNRTKKPESCRRFSSLAISIFQ
jgi:hypothetical protein